MLDQNGLQAIAQLINTSLQPVNERLDKMQKDLESLKEDVSELKEDTKVTRASVNTLLDWAEDAQIEVKIPLYKKAQ